MILKTRLKEIVAFFDSCNRKSPGKILGGLFLIVGYSYGVFQESFWSDDYPSLVDPNGTYKEVFGDARPIFGLLTKYSYIAIGEPQYAWVLRLISLAGLLVLYSMIISKLRSENWRIPIFVAIGFSLPSFQMYLLWAGCWPHVWTMIISLAAYQYWSRNSVKFKAIGICLMALSFTIYPPSTFFTFSYLFLLAWYKKFELSEIIHEFRKLATLFIIGCSAGLAGSMALMHIFEVERNSRLGVVTLTELPMKIVWIITRPVVVGFRPFMIDSPSVIVALCSSLPFILLYLVGVYAQSRTLEENFLKRATVLSSVLFSSLIPLLITKDNQFEFRTIAGFSWGILIVILIFLQETKFLINFKFSKFISNVLILLMLSVGVFSININYKELFRDPYVVKNHFLESEILRCKQDSGVKSILVLDALEPYPTRNRLGVYSTVTDLAHSWVIRPNVRTLSKKLDVGLPIFFSSSLGKKSSGQCLIDLEKFRILLVKGEK